jgi:hypothetical protein
MCRSEMAQMYRSTYVPFQNGTYVPAKKKSLFLSLKNKTKSGILFGPF